MSYSGDSIRSGVGPGRLTQWTDNAPPALDEYADQPNTPVLSSGPVGDLLDRPPDE